MRAYAQAKRLYDNATDSKHLPRTPMIALVKQIDFALSREDIAKNGSHQLQR
jgi:hypothetical protein